MAAFIFRTKFLCYKGVCFVCNCSKAPLPLTENLVHCGHPNSIRSRHYGSICSHTLFFPHCVWNFLFHLFWTFPPFFPCNGIFSLLCPQCGKQCLPHCGNNHQFFNKMFQLFNCGCFVSKLSTFHIVCGFLFYLLCTL